MSLIVALFSEKLLVKAPLPADWHLKAKMKSIESTDEINLLLEGPDKEKHVFIEFYTMYCKFCYMFVDDYNKVYDFFMDNFGEE